MCRPWRHRTGASRADPPEVDDPDPELADVAVPVTCWPTVRSTEATVPAIVDVNVASAALACAVVTWDWAEAMLALSRAICVADALAASSVASSAWSLARVAWAWANEASRTVGSTVASVCPTATV